MNFTFIFTAHKCLSRNYWRILHGTLTMNCSVKVISLFPKFIDPYDIVMVHRYISLLFSILYMQPMWNAKGGNTNFTFTESVSVNFFTFTCEIVVAYHGIYQWS